jgi:hypothetical protein
VSPIPAQLTPAEADTLGAAVALLQRLEAAQGIGLRTDMSAWDGLSRGRSELTFSAGARAVTQALIVAAITGQCSEAQRVLDAMDEADELVRERELS